MPTVSDDRRSIRTRKFIRQALSELIEEKGFNNISVTDITTRAAINRGTFYLHYSDKYDMLEKIESEVIQEFYSIAQSINCSKEELDNEMEILCFMSKYFHFIKENSTFMKAILGPKGDPNFQIKIKQLIKENLFEKMLLVELHKDKMLVPEDYLISYILSAHLGVIQYWLESGMKNSPEEMTLILSKMFFLGPFKASGLGSLKD